LDSKKGEKTAIFYPARKNELRMQTRAMFIFQNSSKIFLSIFKHFYNILFLKIYIIKITVSKNSKILPKNSKILPKNSKIFPNYAFFIPKHDF
jgi:hypothetical protein